MTKEEVNESFLKLNLYNTLYFLLLSIFFIFLVSILVIKVGLYGKVETNYLYILIPVICMIITPAIFIPKEIKARKRFKNWKEKIRKEYINKLPLEKQEVIDYKSFGESSDDGKMKIEFIYLRNNIKTAETITTFIKTVEGLETPYIEYQYLEQSLPKDGIVKGFEKGYYNSTLYITK